MATVWRLMVMVDMNAYMMGWTNGMVQSAMDSEKWAMQVAATAPQRGQQVPPASDWGKGQTGPAAEKPSIWNSLLQFALSEDGMSAIGGLLGKKSSGKSSKADEEAAAKDTAKAEEAQKLKEQREHELALARIKAGSPSSKEEK
ncbi:MAG: hypothetical protein U0003_01570 [Vampirovibrionales bacterium]